MVARRGANPSAGSPISLAVFTSIAAALLVVLFVGSISVAYALMNARIHSLQAQQASQAIPTCRALKELALARNGAVYFDPGNPRSYENRIANDMIVLYETTGCVKITGPLT